MNEKLRKIKGINKQNSTKYGEMIPTNFAWISLEEQKKKANHIANLGKKNENTK